MQDFLAFMPLAMSAPAPRTTPATGPGAMPAATVAAPATGAAPAVVPGSMPVVGTGPSVEAPVLPAPAELTQTGASKTEITLSWKDITGETGYKVYRSADGTKFDLVAKLPADTVTYKDPNLTVGTRYVYQVKGYNDAGAEGAAASKEAATSASFMATYGNIFLIVIVIAGLYFFMIRGQKKQEKKKKELINELKKGDRVMTIGGLVARVVSIEGEEVVLKIDESANVKATYRKTAIQEVLDRDEKK